MKRSFSLKMFLFVMLVIGVICGVVGDRYVREQQYLAAINLIRVGEIKEIMSAYGDYENCHLAISFTGSSRRLCEADLAVIQRLGPIPNLFLQVRNFQEEMPIPLLKQILASPGLAHLEIAREFSEEGMDALCKSCPTLRALTFNSAKVSDKSLQRINDLPFLRSFAYNSSRFVSMEIARLKHLQRMYIKTEFPHHSVPRSKEEGSLLITDLVALSEASIDIYESNCKTCQILRCPKIEKLKLRLADQCKCTIEPGDNSKISELSLRCGELDDPNSFGIKKMPNLQTLEIQSGFMSRQFLASLSTLPALKTLRVQVNNAVESHDMPSKDFTGFLSQEESQRLIRPRAVWHELGKCAELRELAVSLEGDLEIEDLSWLAKLTNLQTLRLCSKNFVTRGDDEKAILKKIDPSSAEWPKRLSFLKALPQLKVLQINIHPDTKLEQHFPNLMIFYKDFYLVKPAVNTSTNNTPSASKN